MNEFIDYLKELFESFGPVQVRKMFGGYGVYYDGIMFALVEDDTLYLKADDSSAADYESRGLARFEYIRAGKTVKLSYYQAPEEILDNPDDAADWARRAYAAAVRAKPRARRKG